MLKYLVIGLFAILGSFQAFGYGTGYSSYPLLPDNNLVSMEFAGITSTGGGAGLQGRFTRKLGKYAVADAGISVAGGEFENSIFAGVDYELFPDYGKQPKISVKANFEHAKQFNFTRNVLSFAPTLSKGFSFWGEEAFPFVSLPFGINLEGDKKTYQTQINLNMGITGNLPIKDFRHLLAMAELTIDLKDSYTGIFFGVSYPID